MIRGLSMLSFGSGSRAALAAVLVLSATAAVAKSDRPARSENRQKAICATTPERMRNAYARALYRESLDRREALSRPARAAAEPRAAADTGDVAVVEDDGSIVVSANTWDLSGKSFRFEPGSSSAYRVVSTSSTFSAAGGTALPLGDDDSRSVA